VCDISLFHSEIPADIIQKLKHQKSLQLKTSAKNFTRELLPNIHVLIVSNLEKLEGTFPDLKYLSTFAKVLINPIEFFESRMGRNSG